MLLSLTCVSTIFLLGFLVFWTYEKVTGSSADMEITIAFITLAIILGLGLYFCM
jgi:hypothetical protein